jgi:ribosomal protein S18 acetylase RimI-like enzyme
MIATANLVQEDKTHLRAINIVRDLPKVADLVEKCFADTMDADGRAYLQQMRRAGQDNFFLRWASNAVETVSMPLSGYIWEEAGEIIGNVSLIPYRRNGKKNYLIANVAVRADFRKRGIGRALTQAAIQHAKQHHAYQTWLHVRDDNPGAIKLYRSLGFVDVAQRTNWQLRAEREIGVTNLDFRINKRTIQDWPLQHRWLYQLYPELLAWYQPMPWNTLRPGFGPALVRFFSDNDVRHWVARVDDAPSVIASWQTIDTRNSRLWVAIPPNGNPKILTTLLIHVQHELKRWDKISLDFPARMFTESIEAAGFHQHRTLLWMLKCETSSAENRNTN